MPSAKDLFLWSGAAENSGKAGGYFPGFEYGAAGSGYILATVYVHTKDEELLETAIGAATYIQNVAVYSDDHEAALVPYTGLYHGSAGCASSLVALAQYLLGGTYGPSYLEDPYRNLYVRI